jgi:hypothetical protein
MNIDKIKQRVDALIYSDIYTQRISEMQMKIDLLYNEKKYIKSLPNDVQELLADTYISLKVNLEIVQFNLRTMYNIAPY